MTKGFEDFIEAEFQASAGKIWSYIQAGDEFNYVKEICQLYRPEGAEPEPFYMRTVDRVLDNYIQVRHYGKEKLDSKIGSMRLITDDLILEYYNEDW